MYEVIEVSKYLNEDVPRFLEDTGVTKINLSHGRGVVQNLYSWPKAPSDASIRVEC